MLVAFNALFNPICIKYCHLHTNAIETVKRKGAYNGSLWNAFVNIE